MQTVLLVRGEWFLCFCFADSVILEELSHIADGVLSDVWAAMKSSQFGYVVPAACAATRTDLKIVNGGREQCEGVRRGRSCVQHPHADAGAPLHDERVLLPWDDRVTS